MGRRGKIESIEENLEIVIGEVESEVIRKLGRVFFMFVFFVWDWEREREGGGEGGGFI